MLEKNTSTVKCLQACWVWKERGKIYGLSPVCISDKTSELLAYFIFEEKKPILLNNWVVQNVQEVQNEVCQRYKFIIWNHLEKNGVIYKSRGLWILEAFEKKIIDGNQSGFVLLQVSSLSSGGSQESVWSTVEPQSGWSVAFPKHSLPPSDTPVLPLIPWCMSLLW